MDCNKEEAIRAKGIAEKKMQNKDFLGARKICMKAQQLYSDLENISQMLMVCDVHCSAEQKLLGNEMDWYGILQIDQKADELTIKKQYRKFALQLHPDKNKFSGAEAAFKLIGEAQMILLDRNKRNLHDQKRNASVSKTAVPYRPSQNSSWKFYAGAQNNFSGNFSGINLQKQQQQQPTQPGNALSTFWTSCPYCKIKYQYYRAHMHKSLNCQNCKKPFIAYETNMQAPTTNLNQAYAAYAQQRENVSAEKRGQKGSQKGGCSSGIRSKKVNRKKEKKPVLESSESSALESSSDSEEDMVIEKDAVHQGLYGEQRRKSSRSKQQVSYNEKVSDDEIPAPKRGKRSGSSCATEEQSADASKGVESKMNSQSEPATNAKGHEEREEQKENACFQKSMKVGAKESLNVYNDKECIGSNKGVHENPPADTSSHETPERDDVYSFPKSDFHDFAEIRKQECFKVGQHWAIYDNQNGMPRFYARIKRLYSPGSKLQVTWLEARPDDSDGKKWANADLPISCGKFTLGPSECIYSTATFSHVISLEKVRNVYKIYPRKGETWAIFKNWNMNWCSDPESKREYEYEFVEILSEYVEGVGTCVALLQKVEGFVSVFCQMVHDATGRFLVPPGEYLRFSHRVPSYKLNGHEGTVPSGSVELDPASMLFSVGARDKPACDEVHDNEVVHIDVPDPEFYNFDAAKSPEKFQRGQIWALYSDEDGLPKYYGHIKEIYCSQSKLKIVISWLECSSLPDNVIKWHDEEIPISCGTFMVTKSTQKYDCTMSFSHLVKAPLFNKTNVDILPSRGDIWALYKDWSPDISTSGLGTCEYDIVEVSEDSGLERKVLVLGRVDGFNSVFKVKMNGGLAETMTIPQHELLRFSHSIPSFRLTDEKGGSLRGCWELDPAALPVRFFSHS